MLSRPWRRVAFGAALVTSAIATLPCPGVAQPSATPGSTLTIDTASATPLPRDPKIVVGTLPNGIRYYVRRNEKPEKRAELRLVVNVGSIVEDDDQKGLAHFLEHMAFNGTARFPTRGS